MKSADISTLPAPLTSPDCDLRDFAFMPLDVVRLRDSDLAVTAEADEFRCAVLLWCASWHQVPAASLPDDDKILAQYAGYGRVVKEWQKVRQGALRGWVKCADGRLYHPVVADKANEAWLAKLRQRLKTECARIKKHNERHGTSIQFPDFDTWLSLGCPTGQPLFVPRDKPKVSPGQGSNVTGENHSKGQGEGQGQGLKEKGDFEHSASAQRNLPPAGDPRGVPEADEVTVAVGKLCIAMRSFGINAAPGDMALRKLAADGVTVETITAACEEAKRSKPDEAIGPAYVVSIIVRWARKAAELNAAGAAPPKAASTTYQTANDKARTWASRINGGKRNGQQPADDDNIIDLNAPPARSLG